jgi:hypothetical protein
MRRLAGIAAACVVLLLAAAPADAFRARHMSAPVAQRNAERAAEKKARQSGGKIVSWELARGFRFTARKFVFVWWASMSDGRVCSAQLVVRYASSKTNKIVSYFRLETCS